MKTTLRLLLVLLATASAANAAGAEGQGMGLGTFLFLGFLVLILACQLFPAISLFLSMVKGVFSRAEHEKAVPAMGSKHDDLF